MDKYYRMLSLVKTNYNQTGRSRAWNPFGKVVEEGTPSKV